jgi:hypothetical protein
MLPAPWPRVHAGPIDNLRAIAHEGRHQAIIPARCAGAQIQKQAQNQRASLVESWRL